MTAVTPTPGQADPWQVITDMMSELLRGGQTADIRCRAALGVLASAGIDFDGNPVAIAARKAQPSGKRDPLSCPCCVFGGDDCWCRTDCGAERCQARDVDTAWQPQPAPGESSPLGLKHAVTSNRLGHALAALREIAELSGSEFPRCAARNALDDDAAIRDNVALARDLPCTVCEDESVASPQAGEWQERYGEEKLMRLHLAGERDEARSDLARMGRLTEEILGAFKGSPARAADWRGQAEGIMSRHNAARRPS